MLNGERETDGQRMNWRKGDGDASIRHQFLEQGAAEQIEVQRSIAPLPTSASPTAWSQRIGFVKEHSQVATDQLHVKNIERSGM